jgi:hypothetical protein
MARVFEPLVIHDPRSAAVAALDDHDVPLIEVTPTYLAGRDGDDAVPNGLASCSRYVLTCRAINSRQGEEAQWRSMAITSA